jgi:hypothetical protein
MGIVIGAIFLLVGIVLNISERRKRKEFKGRIYVD